MNSSFALIIFIVLLVSVSIVYKSRKRLLNLRKNIDLLDPKIKLLFDEVGQPYDEFILEDNDIFYFINNQFNYNAVCFMISKIMNHLKVWCYFDVKIFVDDEKSNLNPGMYSNIFGKQTITIRLKKMYSYEQIIAILCHECVHHFLYNKNIKLLPELENELLTDIATIYLGFGKYIKEGYQEIVRMTTIENRQREIITKIGYIDIYQINYIYDVLKKLKQGIPFEYIHKSKIKRNRQKIYYEFKENLKKELEILNKVILRNSEVASIVIKNKNISIIKEDFESIQRNVINIENKIYTDRYDKLKYSIENTNSISKSEYQGLKCEISNLGLEVTEMINVLEKYI